MTERRGEDRPNDWLFETLNALHQRWCDPGVILGLQLGAAALFSAVIVAVMWR